MLRALFVILSLAAALVGCPKKNKGPEPPTPDTSVDATAAGEGEGPKACASTQECPAGQRCSVEDGACEKPPGCQPGDICAAVCYGVCTSTTTILPPPGACEKDEDCRAFSDYCTGCDCRALSKDQKDPTCPGPGVRCFADPCMNRRAVCRDNKCATESTRVQAE